TAPYGLLDVYGDGSRTNEVADTLDRGLALRIRAQARLQRVSPATLFHAAWGLVTAHTSGRDDVVFGTVLFGHLHMSGGARHRIGVFLNTRPVPLRFRSVTTRELISRTQQELLGCMQHEHVSLAVAQRCSGISSALPLFTSLLNFRYADSDPEVDWANTAAGTRVLDSRVWTNYPITISVDDQGEDFRVTAQVDCRVDAGSMLDYVVTALRSIVTGLEQEPSGPALRLPILSATQRH